VPVPPDNEGVTFRYVPGLAAVVTVNVTSWVVHAVHDVPPVALTPVGSPVKFSVAGFADETLQLPPDPVGPPSPPWFVSVYEILNVVVPLLGTVPEAV
jgi:hypothetical protein